MPPIFTIDHGPPSLWNSITSPFENLAATLRDRGNGEHDREREAQRERQDRDRVLTIPSPRPDTFPLHASLSTGKMSALRPAFKRNSFETVSAPGRHPRAQELSTPLRDRP